ncbi:DUF6939 family protein [Streptomyces sp. NPDC020951]|uniref:DUF6939 family protein n=1 Tax=Streptomyces sp. NPDC020951 TaxID=3365104 RepID=UPI0037B26CC2
MTIHIAGRRQRESTILAKYPGAPILDVTSRGADPWAQLSPFYPHGGIPVPFFPDMESASVEGIWQALKVFENADVDFSKLRITTMKGIKRTSRTLGKVLGHRTGPDESDLINYAEARASIYLPSYRWVLENRTQSIVEDLQKLAAKSEIVLLDYNTSEDVFDLSKPLSHAVLVRLHIMGEWPGKPGSPR